MSFTESDTYDLLALPGKDNFAGLLYPLNILKLAEHHENVGFLLNEKNETDGKRMLTLLDASGMVPTHRLNLSDVTPSFTVLSFYKMFGLPTSVGALIIRNDVFPILSKKYFGGGSTITVRTDTKFAGFKKDFSKYEDGTVDFLGISMIKNGLDTITELGIDNITQWVHNLSIYCV